jgi:hypothetical protein
MAALQGITATLRRHHGDIIAEISMLKSMLWSYLPPNASHRHLSNIGDNHQSINFQASLQNSPSIPLQSAMTNGGDKFLHTEHFGS